ncbi:5-oxoprolinase [Bacterioplanes sanyensis]|uniref:hydantoinase B/oxoprolinase family protein n=1 Tax=Bacterioplanes sanyensis TaxID=1249553 RepID=UPI00167529CF|nr:hydantoinase B/oxoprolinase family protein [Bacterioplanes sanyensis]GGY48458.1 5-oxoprolinase [Bacterioplanes sanyensis]
MSDSSSTHVSSTHNSEPGWRFWIDRGGTFTDIVATTPDGQQLVHKLLSENPQHYADAAIEGIQQLQSQWPQLPNRISEVRMGTTVATNALLERRGQPTVLLVSQGLRDQLQIGYQARPEIFALHTPQPTPLYERVYEVPERVLVDGTVELALDEEACWLQLQEAHRQGYRAIAVALMHAYKYPEHEQRLGELARAAGFEQVSLSHEVSPLIKLVARGSTTVADAYLSPVLKRYVEQVRRALPGVDVQFMQSNGGLTSPAQFAGKDAVLSGPAGGVVGMVKTACADGFDRIIGFDMGGTSTDVSHYGGELERDTETLIADVRLRVPMMSVHTVAAGGGSVVQFRDGRLQVGPESAGAYPGPACYRNGGPLTVTDCNLLLGRIQAEHFPAIFGPQQNQPVDVEGVQQQFEQLAHSVSVESGRDYSPEALAEAFLTVAVDNMAAAIRKISVQRGHDLASYVLNAFGGAGAQHACQVAQALGIEQVYLHPQAGVLSAYGIGLAEQRWLAEKSMDVPLAQLAQDSRAAEQVLEALWQDYLHQPGSDTSAVKQVRLYLRYEGADTPLLVAYGDAATMQQAFEQQHRQLYGFINEQRAIVADALQLECIAGGEDAAPVSGPAPAQTVLPSTVRMHCQGQWCEVPVYARSSIAEGEPLQGPALLTERTSTIVLEPGWQLQCLASGALLLTQQQAKQPKVTDTERDPLRLELFSHLFMSAAEQMGVVLEQTASSVNIKERLDFSCAVFDQHGNLVANAPHIPVHLGSMSDSIRVVIQGQPDMRPGDAFVLNTPYNGGTHLPDITVVKPVFTDGANPAFYVAARGHHADIGGISPGSMPAESSHIEQEGVLLDNLLLMRDGALQEQSIRAALANTRYPARNPEQNIADLSAQLAACEKGAQELLRLCQQYGEATVQAYMGYVQDNAAEVLSQALMSLADGQFSCDMDDGSRIQVAIQIDRQQGRACIDFNGTGYRPDQLQHPGNFNAPTSVVHAAVLYSFRVLVNKPIPLNAGFFRPLDIRVPKASMVAPEYPAAVVSGNVETAQYLVDAVMGALNLMAASQGTNNNVTFGDAQYQYYETLCGGTGASAVGDGVSAMHSHMTNSRLTDPEVLEQRYPVVLDWFHIRRLSGGHGLCRGGDGVERHIRFLQPMQANIISGRRQVAPHGLAGGDDGKTGCNFVLRRNGRLQNLPGCTRTELQAGDSLCVHTPGGGGYGRPLEDD